jgi:hypothetical protein
MILAALGSWEYVVNLPSFAMVGPLVLSSALAADAVALFEYVV